MPKPKTIFVCSACGYESPRWYGKCPSCESWNTLEETAPQAVSAIAPKPQKQRGGTGAQAQKIYEIEAGAQTHEPTGIGEFDRVLGGGIVEGSLMLVGRRAGRRQKHAAAAGVRAHGAHGQACAVCNG